MKKQLIVFDLDSTILPHVEELPARTADVLRAAVAAGHFLVIATARPWAMTRFVYRALGLTTPACLLNGAQIVQPGADDHEPPVLLADRAVCAADAAELLSHALKLPGIYDVIRAYGEELYTLLPPRSIFMRTYAKYTGRQVLLPDVEMTPAPASRLMLYTLSEACWGDLERLLDPFRTRYVVRNIFRCRADGTPVWRADVYSRAAGKWNAVRTIAQRLGVAESDIWCFGDEWNDEEMLLSAAHGYAMQGSVAAEALAGRCAVTPLTCAECGVADVVEREILHS